MRRGDSTGQTFTRVLRRTIDDDLVSETPDRLADVLYLHFMLENHVENQLTDNLVDRLASEIDLVLNRGEKSRFADREITAAVFGAFVLSKAGIAKANWDKDKIASVLRPYRKGDLCFDNLTYTLLIGVADSALLLNLGVKDELERTIPEQIRTGQLFNDGKNVAIACMYAMESKSESLVVELVERSSGRIERGEVPFDERVYYAWVIWKNRGLVQKSELKTLTKYVDSTLENVVGLIRDNPDEPSIEAVFGADSKRRFSRILMGFALDLASSFEANTYRVTDREVKTLSITGRISTAVASGMMVYFSFLVITSMINAGLLSALPSGPLVESIGAVLLGVAGILFAVFLVTTAASLFWDTTIQSVLPDRIILKNAVRRIRKVVIEIVAIAIVGRIVGLFL